MAILIRRISADGAVEDRIDGEVVIGRSTDCTVSLPGLLVALRHARVTPLARNRLKLESLSATGVEVNGVPGVQSAELQPDDVVRIGGHRLRVGVESDTAVIEIELADPASGPSHEGALTSLESAGLRMRRPAIWLAATVLIVGFLIPLATRYLPPAAAVIDEIPTDALWLTDGISNVHQHFGADCAKCHETLFVPVRDSACLSCHQGIAHHSDDPAILKVDGLADRRCASCHREHQGAHGMVPRHPGICADCHAHPQRFTDFPDLRLVRDFGNAHPEFRPTVTTADQRVLARVAIGPGLRDHSGLIFPHDVHLKAGGVRGPERIEQLDCDGCHVRRRGEPSFQPVAFTEHCQRCHELDLDVGGRALRLPHGDPQRARDAVRAASAMPGAIEQESESGARRRPGEAAPRQGPQSVDALVDDAIGNRVCAKCHEISSQAGQPVSVRAPKLRPSWLVHAQFTHDAHAWQKCDECHANQDVAGADQLSLPSIESCRACHGAVNSRDKLQSTCVDCHRFHQAGTLAMGASGDEQAGKEPLSR